MTTKAKQGKEEKKVAKDPKMGLRWCGLTMIIIAAVMLLSIPYQRIEVGFTLYFSSFSTLITSFLSATIFATGCSLMIMVKSQKDKEKEHKRLAEGFKTLRVTNIIVAVLMLGFFAYIIMQLLIGDSFFNCMVWLNLVALAAAVIAMAWSIMLLAKIEDKTEKLPKKYHQKIGKFITWKKVAIVELVIVLAFAGSGIAKLMSNKTYNSNAYDAHAGREIFIPKGSYFSSECCMFSARFYSLRSKSSLEAEINDYLATLEYTDVGGTNSDRWDGDGFYIRNYSVINMGIYRVINLGYDLKAQE